MPAQVAHFLVLYARHHEVAFAVLQRRGDRICKPFCAGRSDLYAIDHQFDVVVLDVKPCQVARLVVAGGECVGAEFEVAAEAAFIGQAGESSRIMHQGVRYADASNSQPPTSIPATV